MPTYPGADGVTLHLDVHGGTTAASVLDDGVLTVAIAGGPARHPDYLGDLAGLLPRRGAVVPHLRGVGRSPAPDDDDRGSAWSQADDLEALRRHVGADRLALLAHSAGARLAVAYAARFPDRVARLDLLTPSTAFLPDLPPDADDVAARRADDPGFAAAWATIHAGPDTRGDDAFTAWQRAAAPAGYARWGEREQEHAAVGTWSLRAAQRFTAPFPVDDVADRLRALTAPVVVVGGAEDAFTGLAPLRALAELLPNARLVVLDDCGHYPWVERPDAVPLVL